MYVIYIPIPLDPNGSSFWDSDQMTLQLAPYTYRPGPGFPTTFVEASLALFHDLNGCFLLVKSTRPVFFGWNQVMVVELCTNWWRNTFKLKLKRMIYNFLQLGLNSEYQNFCENNQLVFPYVRSLGALFWFLGIQTGSMNSKMFYIFGVVFEYLVIYLGYVPLSCMQKSSSIHLTIDKSLLNGCDDSSVMVKLWIPFFFLQKSPKTMYPK